MSAFRPQYIDGDVEGQLPHTLLPMHRIRHLRPFIVGRARIHLSIERWRVCETWFAPSMAGVDSAGLGEVLQNVLASFSIDDRGLLVQVCLLATHLFLFLSTRSLLFPILNNLSIDARTCS